MSLERVRLVWILAVGAALWFSIPTVVSAQNLEPKNKNEIVVKVKLVHGDHNVVRSGPGEAFSIVGVYPRDAVFVVNAKRDAWYNIRISASETAWIHSSLVEEDQDTSHLEFRPNPKLFSRVGSFVFTGYLGGYAFDRKSNSMALGGRLGYYLFDFLQVEGGLTYSHVVRPAEIVEDLFNLSLEEEEFHMLFYNLNLTVELLPGRQMVPFVTGGAGSTIMLGKSEPSFNLGAGTTMYFGKRTSLRWELRNHRFKTEFGSARRNNSNYEFLIGTSFLL
ncbi:MAG: hypothetical protein HKN21_07075 [Candidatus Eisenbacteria bacterium]|uniref:SH3b domain-containing protein n=1 Tax=Eiseniibacteriota bacterium TaxID=2212470 RepID=A0A7Y2E7C3_UNCEI|nr:hypothetical protein [Candidatus Eisenbacteria bacterium]